MPGIKFAPLFQQTRYGFVVNVGKSQIHIFSSTRSQPLAEVPSTAGRAGVRHPIASDLDVLRRDARVKFDAVGAYGLRGLTPEEVAAYKASQAEFPNGPLFFKVSPDTRRALNYFDAFLKLQNASVFLAGPAPAVQKTDAAAAQAATRQVVDFINRKHLLSFRAGDSEAEQFASLACTAQHLLSLVKAQEEFDGRPVQVAFVANKHVSPVLAQLLSSPSAVQEAVKYFETRHGSVCPVTGARLNTAAKRFFEQVLFETEGEAE